MNKAIIESGLSALEALFATPNNAGFLELPKLPCFQLLGGLFKALITTYRTGMARMRDYFNALEREIGAENFSSVLCGELFESCVEHRVLPAELAAPTPNATTQFMLDSCIELLSALHHIRENISEEERKWILPEALKMFDTLPKILQDKSQTYRAIANELLAKDRFGRNRSFRYIGGNFIPVELESSKPLKRFFGFHSVRSIYLDHFRNFTNRITNIPLLVYSLPGYGKTSMIISHAMATPKAVLILPDPEYLERGWLDLVAPLARRTDHRFILFFDDIDPRSIDWYSFRTHVGGAFSLPENVMPVIASNYEFPAGILSRGRRVSYPVFDELRCTEMIEDFLHDFGLKKIPQNLVSLIGADYTEEFGQKKFTELSPRTLMRYLAIYQRDFSKRKTMIELSLGQVITRPDAELFYEFNINLMRSLYGEEYITKLRNEQLRNL